MTARKKKPLAKEPKMVISNNEFCAVKWEANAVEAVKVVAEALRTNSHALRNLTELFRSQNVQVVEAMLSVNPPRR
jgi:hypothetical protein